jgi:hypothetical protein
LSHEPTGTVFGTNTVLEVEFEILGAGHFNGQEPETGLMRGYVYSCSIYYPIAFHRTGPASAAAAVINPIDRPEYEIGKSPLR